jgi:hypothetical protein
MYDSTEDTNKHINQVGVFLYAIIRELQERARVHDASKLEEPEKSMYDEFTPKLRDSTYGSDEYKGFLKDMGTALQHHYENNSHHPEHYPNGINDMSLLDVIEMLADWKAAGMRHSNGSIEQSLEINRKRFNISDQLYDFILNTVKELGW